MKNQIFVFCFVLGFSGILSGQKIVDINQSLAGVNSIKFNFQWADVVFKKSDNNQLQIKGTALINNGENNDNFEVAIEKNSGVINVVSNIKNYDDLPKYITAHKGDEKFSYRVEGNEDFNRSAHPELEGVHNWEGPNVLKTIKLTVYIPSSMELEVQSTYGDLEIVDCVNPMSIENTYGSVIASFSAIPKECDIESTYSFVDLSIPKNLSAGFDLHTNHGEIYTDLNLEINTSRGKAEVFDNNIVADLNRGGSKINVEATYNNIYLRGK